MSAIIQEMNHRLLQRLHYMNLNPQVIYVLGWFTEQDQHELTALFPEATIIQKTPAEMTLAAYLLKTMPSLTDFAKADLLLCQFGYMPQDALSVCLQASGQLINKDGVLLFSAFGPDSFAGLINPGYQFVDMHHYGDDLLQAGFNDPVMDMHPLNFRYQTEARFQQDLQSLQDLLHESDFFLEANFQNMIEVEVVTGHAWGLRPPRQQAVDGEVLVPFPF